jgi:hypothetical protein
LTSCRFTFDVLAVLVDCDLHFQPGTGRQIKKRAKAEFVESALEKIIEAAG